MVSEPTGSLEVFVRALIHNDVEREYATMLPLLHFIHAENTASSCRLYKINETIRRKEIYIKKSNDSVSGGLVIRMLIIR